jgi:uncharacterized membrane protein (DUF485 family)
MNKAGDARVTAVLSSARAGFPAAVLLDYAAAPHGGLISMTDPHPDQDAHLVSRNARYGLLLFAVYVALYLGFIMLNAFDPERMQQPVLAGVNLAVVYGVGLIAAALVLALVYLALCRRGATSK